MSLRRAKLIIIETWGGGAHLAQAGEGCSSVFGRVTGILGGGGGHLPPCAPWIKC